MIVDRLEGDKKQSVDMIHASGICGHISRLAMEGSITDPERDAVRGFVMISKPSDKQFTKYITGKHWTGNTFWWRPISQERETAQIRINFLREIIKTV